MATQGPLLLFDENGFRGCEFREFLSRNSEDCTKTPSSTADLYPQVGVLNTGDGRIAFRTILFMPHSPTPLPRAGSESPSQRRIRGGEGLIWNTSDPGRRSLCSLALGYSLTPLQG
jgi:hypothetical protein